MYSSIGSSSCTNCTASTYRTTGMQACADCDEGMYSLMDYLQCIRTCTFQTIVQITIFKYQKDLDYYLLISGMYSSIGSSSCTDCTAGTYRTTGMVDCLDCSVNQYSAARAATCSECDGGMYKLSKYIQTYISMNYQIDL